MGRSGISFRQRRKNPRSQPGTPWEGKAAHWPDKRELFLTIRTVRTEFRQAARQGSETTRRGRKTRGNTGRTNRSRSQNERRCRRKIPRFQSARGSKKRKQASLIESKIGLPASNSEKGLRRSKNPWFPLPCLFLRLHRHKWLVEGGPRGWQNKPGLFRGRARSEGLPGLSATP